MLDLKYTETSSIVTINGKKISLPFIATDPLPVATIPSFIHVARNTSVQVPKEFAATRIYQLAKLRPPYETYREGKMVADPANIKPQTIVIEPAQFAPSQVADKLTVKAMDLFSPNMDAAMEKSVAGWLYERRLDLERAIIKALVKASKNTQDKIIKNKGDEHATDFANGAHFVTETITTPEQAEESFFSASQVLTQVGLECASTNYDRQNRFVSGFGEDSILCLCSPMFLRKLTSKAGLVSSSQGYEEIFKAMDVKRVFGFDVLAVRNLPRGINFIFITTGPYGAFVYNSAVQGAKMITKDSPDGADDKIAFLSYTYIAGIANESFIVASVNEKFVMPENDTVIPLISKTITREVQSFADLSNEPQTYQTPENVRKKK